MRYTREHAIPGITQIAAKRGTLTLRISSRDLTEQTGMCQRTAANALRWHAQHGTFIPVVTPPRLGHAGVYRLHRPPAVVCSLEPGEAPQGLVGKRDTG